MNKKLTYLALVLVFGLASSAPAANIIWVSDNKTPTNNIPADQGWVDLLTAQGHTVNLSFRNQEGRTLDATKIAALNAADLIIVSRDINSGDYDDGTEPAQWNGIIKPLLLQAAHISRSAHWGWVNTTSTNDSLQTLQAVKLDHPIFNGVTLDGSNRVNILTEASSFASINDAGNGTLIASRADNSQIWIVEWAKGTTFYPGSAQTAGGRRMLFISGTDSGIDGRYNLTAEGQTMFLNAVNYLLTFKQLKAYSPNPSNGAQNVRPTSLTWSAGDTAAAHDVYFGYDATIVANATTSSVEYRE